MKSIIWPIFKPYLLYTLNYFLKFIDLNLNPQTYSCFILPSFIAEHYWFSRIKHHFESFWGYSLGLFIKISSSCLIMFGLWGWLLYIFFIVLYPCSIGVLKYLPIIILKNLVYYGGFFFYCHQSSLSDCGKKYRSESFCTFSEKKIKGVFSPNKFNIFRIWLHI